VSTEKRDILHQLSLRINQASSIFQLSVLIINPAPLIIIYLILIWTHIHFNYDVLDIFTYFSILKFGWIALPSQWAKEFHFPVSMN